MSKDAFMALVKQGVTVLGMLLIAFGHFDQSQVSQISDAVLQVAGSGFVLVSMAWSIYRTWQNAHAKVVSAAVGVPVVVPLFGKPTLQNYVTAPNALRDMQKAGAANDTMVRAKDAA